MGKKDSELLEKVRKQGKPNCISYMWD